MYINLFDSFVSLIKSIFWSTFSGSAVEEEFYKNRAHFIISENKV